MSAGWIGEVSELTYYLAFVTADVDCEGKFKIWGNVTIGMGGEEAVVHGNAEYSVEGKRCNLAAGLRTTSYGIGVGVF